MIAFKMFPELIEIFPELFNGECLQGICLIYIVGFLLLAG